jgi:ATP-binding cassette subfamily C protein LapB
MNAVNVKPNLPPQDTLLLSLLYVARQHDRPLTAEAAVAGLPLVAGRLTPSLFERAAQRAGLSSKLVRRPFEQLAEELCPIVLLLEEGMAVVYLGRDEISGDARVVLPGAQGETRMAFAELLARYCGQAIYLRPEFRFDERTPEVGEVKSRHWFWSVLLSNYALYRDVLLASLLVNLFTIAMPMFAMNVYDRVVPNHATSTLWTLSIGVAIVMVADLLLRTMRSYFLDLAGQRVDVRISSLLMEQVLGQRLEYRPQSAGAFASNLRSFETVRDFMTSATMVVMIDIPFALLFLGFIAWIGVPLVIPIVIGAVVLLIYAWTVQGRMHDLTETTYRAGAQRNATLVESLVGIETIKSHGLEGWMQRKWERTATFLAATNHHLRLLAAATTNGVQWIVGIASVVLMVIGVYMIHENVLSLGGLIAAYMLSSRCLAPIAQVAGLMAHYHHATTAFQGLEDIMAKSRERPQGHQFVSRARLRGRIELKNVDFSYPKQETASLAGISMKIEAGERIALLGRVGSGKSTLLKLLLGLYQPTAGAILIDDADLRQLDPAEVRRDMGYVQQDVTLFYATLRENIALGIPNASDDAILAAARAAGIDAWIGLHPEGLGMSIGERGESLSGGQRQGVAIARAMLQDPAIMLLDEPTGAMDHASEEVVKAELQRRCAGKTLLLVTHRTSLLDLVDRIVVIDQGRIVADGPKAQVVEALRQGRD